MIISDERSHVSGERKGIGPMIRTSSHGFSHARNPG